VDMAGSLKEIYKIIVRETPTSQQFQQIETINIFWLIVTYELGVHTPKVGLDRLVLTFTSSLQYTLLKIVSQI
jgi:hypothetical protein